MPDPAAPTQIGPYRILDVIGEGGMGTVYLAEQKEPVRRRAALKVVKLGMDSKAVLTRFEAERRALAMMEHSCIATVFDAGLTATGQPYFAMEYVKGIPITDYCDQHKLSLQERIELFQKVCSGVQHAHLKGVMHRDLKPSNVLVTLQDGKPLPKIIDFGLAKATDHHLVEATIYTEHGQVIGTPEYMSPEQAGLGGLDVDTRTDVYSLGVLLYELLVGELPFGRKELLQQGMLEMQRVIREQEPVKPSTKITTLGDMAKQHASARRLERGELQKKLRGDLDWIVLKALEKDRTRRYETAQELAADLGRHLSFEPVLASPPSVGYRVQKFVRRYRLQCAAGLVVLLAIVGGGVGTAMGYADAREQARIAGERADQIAALAAKDRVYALQARLTEARTVSAGLYPPFPEQVPALDGWLQTYGPLADELGQFEQQLAALRSRALPLSEAERLQRQKEHPRAPELQRLRSEFDNASTDALRAERREQVETLEHEIAVAGYEFADPQDAAQHRALTRLVRELQAFCRGGGPGERGLLLDVQARATEARTVQQRTIEAHRAAWDAAIAGVRASAHYQGHQLTPQAGLVPVGMDRESKLWEFVHLASGTPGKEIPVRDGQSGRLVPTGDMGIVFVLLPGGMLPVEEGKEADHRHGVRLDPFFLSKYEMTQGQWLRLTGRNPAYSAKDNNLALPVERVSWFDGEELLRLQGLALPSELQWEYGIRAGTRTPWWTGTTVESLAGKENFRISKGGNRLLPVGSLAGNGFGLFDMGGNLHEWSLDEGSDYGTERAGDGVRPPAGAPDRVYRGGYFDYGAGDAQSSNRYGYDPTSRIDDLGLRPARTSRP